MKIVVNKCFGGFGLSKEAIERLSELGADGIDVEANRHNPILVQVVEELGKAASDVFAELVIVEIPDGVDWWIVEYDGAEDVAEVHRKWYP